MTNTIWVRLLSSASTVISHVDSTHFGYTVMSTAPHICEMDLLPQNHNPNLIMRKQPTDPSWGGVLQNTWWVLLKIVKVSKNSEKVVGTKDSRRSWPRGGRVAGWGGVEDKITGAKEVQGLTSIERIPVSVFQARLSLILGVEGYRYVDNFLNKLFNFRIS